MGMKGWRGLTGRICSNNPISSYNKKAQALSELAIFGAIFIMLLGILISYGLRYNSQQQLMQQTYRKAMASASLSNIQGRPSFVIPFVPHSTGYVSIKDKHIPDPANTWGLGQVVPLESHAQVTRNFQLHVVPDFGVGTELPELRLNVNGTDRIYKTSGWRVGIGNRQWFEMVFGEGNVRQLYRNWDPIVITFPLIGSIELGIYGIMDPAGGEVFDYETAIRECRMMHEIEARLEYCGQGISIFGGLFEAVFSGDWEHFLGGVGILECLLSFSPFGGIMLPWPDFCTNLHQDPETGYYHSDELDALFQDVPYYARGSKSLGVQPEVEHTTVANNYIRRRQYPEQDPVYSGRVNWKHTRNRHVIINDGFVPGIGLAPIDDYSTRTYTARTELRKRYREDGEPEEEYRVRFIRE